MAALLDVMVISEVLSVLIDADTFERPIYAGNAIQTVKSADKNKVMTDPHRDFRRGGHRRLRTGRKDRLLPRWQPVLPWVEDKVASSDRPDLTSARHRRVGRARRRVRGGFRDDRKTGRQAGRRRGRHPRAAVDFGYAPNDWQVGQTGKVVAPDLYVAVGISGAIQHLAGMKDSKVIVAINKDEEAPIFQVADYGLVADLFTAVPELTGKL